MPAYYYGSLPTASGASLVVLIIAMLAALVLSIVIFVKKVPHHEVRRRQGLGSFLNFDYLIVSPIVKFLYILSSLNIVALYIFFVVASAQAGVGAFFLALLLGAIVFALFEILNRVSFEFVMVILKMREDMSGVHGILARMSGIQEPEERSSKHGSHTDSAQNSYAASNSYATQSSYTTPSSYDAQSSAYSTSGTNAYARQSAPAQANPYGRSSYGTSPSASSSAAPAPSDGSWTCPRCGASGNVGGFCRNCGAPA